MNRFSFICVGVLCLAALAYPAAAQNILPSSFAGWTASAPSVVIPSAGLDQVLQGADAAAFREYIIKSIEQQSYAQGTQIASITLYRLRDPSSAYGAYTFLRNDALSAADLGSYASASPDRALIVVGEMLLDVSVPEKQARPSDADLKQLAVLLDKKADHTPYP